MSVRICRPLALLLAMLLSACASTSPALRASNSAALPGAPGCFWLRNFTGSWTVLNSSQLLVYAPLTSPPWLLQLFERLGFADSERSGMICNDSQDELLVPNWPTHRVPIIAVHQLTRAEERSLMLANGLKPPAQQAGS
jgi:hypothetical protein